MGGTTSPGELAAAAARPDAGVEEILGTYTLNEEAQTGLTTQRTEMAAVHLDVHAPPAAGVHGLKTFTLMNFH